MPIIATAGSSYTPCPPGVHQGVCVDVIDLGMIEVTFDGTTKTQHKVSIVWQVEPTMEDGRPFTAQKRYTLTLSDRGTLRKDLQSWRGRPFTESELKGFDLEVLIGINCLLNVTHAARDGKTYANVDAIMPVHKGMAKMAPTGYVRAKDRPTDDQPQPATEPADHDGFGSTESDDDIPF